MNKDISSSIVVFNQETIKPSSPTPSHLATLKLSLFDQLQFPDHMPTLLFYTSADHNGGSGDDIEERNAKRSHRLKEALSETLTYYYPFAGRIDRDLSAINCNDQGVHYYEARANFAISEVLLRPNKEDFKHFRPTGFAEMGLDLVPLLRVQTTFFRCGGVIICFSLLHKIADAATVCAFAKSWARVARGKCVVVPDFTTIPSRFPAQRTLPTEGTPLSASPRNYISKRFVFDASKIKALQAKAASGTVPQPSRLEALSALVWKCCKKAAAKSRLNPKSLSPTRHLSYLGRPMNISSRLTPPLPDSCSGNKVVLMAIHDTEEGHVDDDLPLLVCKLRGQLKEVTRRLQVDSSVSTILDVFNEFEEHASLALERGDWNFHTNTCRLGFYEVDFGWGKPTWMSFDIWAGPNRVGFMDTRDGTGIEAWVDLVKEDMDLLEHDTEFLKFVTVNPSPLLQQDEYRDHKTTRSAL